MHKTGSGGIDYRKLGAVGTSMNSRSDNKSYLPTVSWWDCVAAAEVFLDSQVIFRK